MLDPPLQPEFAKPPTAPETPHTFTGALIGAVIVLPEPSEMLRLPVVLPLWLLSPTLEMVELLARPHSRRSRNQPPQARSRTG